MSKSGHLPTERKLRCFNVQVWEENMFKTWSGNASEMLGASALLWILVSMLAGSPASAADIKFLSAAALEPVMKEVIPAFERSSGHKVTVAYGATGGNTDRIRKGEAFDVAIASEPQNEALSREGKIAGGSATKLAKVDIGVAVRKGGPKPDISSADTLKRALVAAKAIVVNDPATGSPVSTHLFTIFEREGIAAEMKGKTKLAANNIANFDAVAKGEVDFGFSQSNSIGEEPRIELVGSPPAPYGNSTVFTAGLIASSKEPAASKALITYLSSPAAASVFREKRLSLN